MRIAYVSTDEVNQNLATRWAEVGEIALERLDPRSTITIGEFDAVIYDLDYLPFGYRDEVLQQLLAGSAAGAVAVHSYNLKKSEARTLQARGVLVVRRLTRHLLARLNRAHSAFLKKAA